MKNPINSIQKCFRLLCPQCEAEIGYTGTWVLIRRTVGKAVSYHYRTSGMGRTRLLERECVGCDVIWSITGTMHLTLHGSARCHMLNKERHPWRGYDVELCDRAFSKESGLTMFRISAAH